MSSSNNQTSTQKAYEIGKNGGTVNTNGMADQDAKRIAAAVNAGRQDAGKQGK